MAAPRLTPIAQRAVNAERRLQEVSTERDLFREVLKDMAEHGTRFDTNPTVGGSDAEIVMQLLTYIGRMDTAVRDRAKQVLRTAFDS